MNIIGMQSNTYLANNKFGIDFKKFNEAGVGSLDFQDFVQVNNKIYKLSEEEFVNYLTELKKEADKYHQIFNQLHSIWDPVFLFEHPEIDVDSLYIKTIEAAYYLGAKYVVMHTVCPKDIYLWDPNIKYETLYGFNLDFFKKLIPIAKKYNTKIAIENLPFLGGENFFSPSNTLKLVNVLNDDSVVMCLDTGHFNIFKEDIYDFLVNAKGKVQCFHIHDNYGDTDAHNFIHDGTFNWNKFAKALKDIKFEGVLSLETFAKKEKHNNDELLCHELNKKLVNSLKELF